MHYSRIIHQDIENIYNEQRDVLSLNHKTFLITGATGVVLSYLVYFLLYLVDCGYNINIIITSRDSKKVLDRFGNHTKNLKVIIIQNIEQIQLKQYSKIDYIIHGASQASSIFNVQNPISIIQSNTIGTKKLLDLSIEKKVNKFIYLSSGQIYGNAEKSPLTQDDCGLLNSTAIKNCYAQSKRMGEMICSAYLHQFGVKSSIIRLGHTFGPTINVDNDERIFSKFIRSIVYGQSLIIKNIGAKRPFCYIGDFISAMLKIIICDCEYNVYNIMNRLIKINDIAIMLQNKYDITVIRENRNIVDYVQTSSQRFLKQFDYTFNTSIDDAIHRTVLHYNKYNRLEI